MSDEFTSHGAALDDEGLAKEHLDITTVLDDETLACLRSRVEALPL
ncbi:hypothetical protein [Pseudomonas sp. LB3P38]